MTAQTSYDINQDKGYAGGIYGIGPRVILSYSAEGKIAFGVAAGRGTDPEGQAVVGLGGGYVGVTVRSLERENVNNAVVEYSDKETVGVMDSGMLWVRTVAAATAGDPVKFTDANGLISSGAPGAGETAIPGATFVTSASAGELAVINLNGIV